MDIGHTPAMILRIITLICASISLIFSIINIHNTNKFIKLLEELNKDSEKQLNDVKTDCFYKYKSPFNKNESCAIKQSEINDDDCKTCHDTIME